MLSISEHSTVEEASEAMLASARNASSVETQIFVASVWKPGGARSSVGSTRSTGSEARSCQCPPRGSR